LGGRYPFRQARKRKTRFLQARLVNTKSSEETVKVQSEILVKYGAKTVTIDNGLEFALHTKLNELGIKTYFADPYASWQRGTNEYHNSFLRRYLPKKTAFENLTQEELDDIVEEINTRPRKGLKFNTPKEMLELEVKQKGVRIQP